MAGPEKVDVVMVKRVVKLMNSRGIKVVVNAPARGALALDAEGAAFFLQDEELFWCDFFGTTIEQYRSWYSFEYVERGLCRGVNKKGKRCRKTGISYGKDKGPGKFIVGVSDRCSHHQEKK